MRASPTTSRGEPVIDTGWLYAELRARGFSPHVAIRSITYVLDVLYGPRR